MFIVADACCAIGLPHPHLGDGIPAARHRLTKRGVGWINKAELLS